MTWYEWFDKFVAFLVFDERDSMFAPYNITVKFRNYLSHFLTAKFTHQSYFLFQWLWWFFKLFFPPATKVACSPTIPSDALSGRQLNRYFKIKIKLSCCYFPIIGSQIFFVSHNFFSIFLFSPPFRHILDSSIFRGDLCWCNIFKSHEQYFPLAHSTFLHLFLFPDKMVNFTRFAFLRSFRWFFVPHFSDFDILSSSVLLKSFVGVLCAVSCALTLMINNNKIPPYISRFRVILLTLDHFYLSCSPRYFARFRAWLFITYHHTFPILTSPPCQASSFSLCHSIGLTLHSLSRDVELSICQVSLFSRLQFILPPQVAGE